MAGWSILPLAGLCQLNIEKPGNTPLFDLMFESNSLGPGWEVFMPYQYPGAWETFSGFAAVVEGIVVLSQSSRKVIGLATVVASG